MHPDDHSSLVLFRSDRARNGRKICFCFCLEFECFSHAEAAIPPGEGWKKWYTEQKLCSNQPLRASFIEAPS